ncbi:flavodoxin family protein [Limosilactobacillus caecicola]|uniref:flavodoxin family protein n=1 Tax=Limosilactobacillus caecicola TaxID=2941332 RepID=UPI00203B54F4|nr:flavodoxin [Limosilactobacillus caecicola]
MAKILIATYSWSGQTQRVADQIHSLVPDAAVFSIEVAGDTFDSDMYKTDAIATQQIQRGQYPALINPVPDGSAYDLVLVGSPVWRGRPATPIHTFLKNLNGFKGAVASFYTDAGSAGDYETVFKEWADGLTVLPGHEGSTGLQDWLNQLQQKI